MNFEADMYLRLKPINYLRHAIRNNYLDPLRNLFSSLAMQPVDVMLSYYKRVATSCHSGVDSTSLGRSFRQKT